MSKANNGGINRILAASAERLDALSNVAIKEAFVRVTLIREARDRRHNEPEHEWDYTRRSLTEMNMSAVSAWLIRQRWADTAAVAELPDEREELIHTLFDHFSRDGTTVDDAREVLKGIIRESCGTLETQALRLVLDGSEGQ